MNYLKSFARPDIGWIDKRARQLRVSMAEQIASNFVEVIGDIGGHSHFSLYSDNFLESGALALAFNNSVTDAVIQNSVLFGTHRDLVMIFDVV